MPYLEVPLNLQPGRPQRLPVVGYLEQHQRPPRQQHQPLDHQLPLPQVSIPIQPNAKSVTYHLDLAGGGLFGLPKKPEEAPKPAGAAGKEIRVCIHASSDHPIISPDDRPLWSSPGSWHR